ncbi:MAG: TIGR04255 family protein [Acidobacteria bacterium]|nr:TIGR04255 family protein [Acidobacteriota bacterium]
MHYKNAPITEALIDVRVELPSDVGFSSLDPLRERVKKAYPREESQFLGKTTISLGSPQIKSTSERSNLGFRFFSVDEKQILQARINGFTFSRLAPYETWERLRDEARILWNVYQDVMHPAQITRIAVRYINQINIPSLRAELKDYVNTYPQLSDRIPANLRDFNSFLMSLQLPQEDLKGMAIINEAIGRRSAPDTIPLILDLDVFVEHPVIKEDDQIWELLEQLRDRKNLYFEGCITDKTRELILADARR